MLKQILAVTTMGIRTIPSRLGASMVIIIGIGGVVGVMISVLALSSGLLKTMRDTGRPDRAMVMRSGAVSETSSSVPLSSVPVITDAPGVKHDADGKAIYSAEYLSLLLLSKRDGTEVSVPIRGVGPGAFLLRPEVKIVAGRMFNPGLDEVIVGAGTQALYKDLVLGGEIKDRAASWKIVGVFTSNHDMHESEIMTSNVALQNVLKRAGLSVVTVMLNSPADFARFKESLTSNPNLSVDVVGEQEYLEQQSKRIGDMLRLLGTVVGGIMAIGAIFGALNSMYSAVSARTVEIATLRAIGFGPAPVVTSVLAESLLLSLSGAVLGALICWAIFNGYTVSTSAAGGVSAPQSRVFSMYVSPALITTGIVWALSLGLLGGLLPAIRAARAPVAMAIRDV